MRQTTSTSPSGGVRHALRIDRLHVAVRLGHEAAERVRPQAVVLSVAVEFAEAPAACRSDRLADTLCGAELCAALVHVCESEEYALVECLAERAHAVVRAMAPAGAQVHLELTKVAPPIPGLEGGMTFVISGSAALGSGVDGVGQSTSRAAGAPLGSFGHGE